MKLVMTILVKNEEDIIENNIRFHADQGVDAFLVMDNDSDDQTPAILESLKSDYDLTVIHNSSMEYQQSQWMTALAKKAGKELGADLVISNDADEFWSAKDGSPLKNKLSQRDSIVTVKRYNYILSASEIDNPDAYVYCKNKVVNPLVQDMNDAIYQEKLVLPLQKISPKVVVNPKGLRLIKGGNHRAKHWRFWNTRFSDDIIVEHYPIRSFSQFKKNILNRKKILELFPDKKMSPHYRRWLEYYAQGKLYDEYQRMILTEEESNILCRFGIVDRQAGSGLKKWADYKACESLRA